MWARKIPDVLIVLRLRPCRSTTSESAKTAREIDHLPRWVAGSASIAGLDGFFAYNPNAPDAPLFALPVIDKSALSSLRRQTMAAVDYPGISRPEP